MWVVRDLCTQWNAHLVTAICPSGGGEGGGSVDESAGPVKHGTATVVSDAINGNPDDETVTKPLESSRTPDVSNVEDPCTLHPAARAAVHHDPVCGTLHAVCGECDSIFHSVFW